jgi:hypothetical protein
MLHCMRHMHPFQYQNSFIKYFRHVNINITPNASLTSLITKFKDPTERGKTLLSFFPCYISHLSLLAERRVRVVNTNTSYSGGPGFDCRPRRPAILIEVLRGFPLSLRANAGIVPKIRSRPLPTKSFPTHNYSIILSSTQCCLVSEKAYLNKLPSNQSILFTSKRLNNLSPTYPYRKDQRALPGNLKSQRFLSVSPVRCCGSHCCPQCLNFRSFGFSGLKYVPHNRESLAHTELYFCVRARVSYVDLHQGWGTFSCWKAALIYL